MHLIILFFVNVLRLLEDMSLIKIIIKNVYIVYVLAPKASFTIIIQMVSNYLILL